MHKISILDDVNRSAQKILETQSRDELYATIIKESQRSIDAKYGLLFLKEANRLELVYSSSQSFKNFKPVKNSPATTSLKSREIKVLHQKLISRYYPDAARKNIRTMTIIPLFHQNEDLGSIIVCNINEEVFSQDIINMLRLYGTLSSLGIINTRSHEEITHALEIRDKFISLASHELRTPLTSLNGYIQLLHNKLTKKDSVEARWIQELSAESNRLTQLIKDLLDINRIKQGQMEFILQEVDMKKIIGTAIDRIHFIDTDHPIVFNQITKDKNAKVIGDFDKLLEMISALLSNAIKFSNPHTDILVSLRTTSRWVKVQIKDEGKGIPKKDIDRIFEGFYKTIQNAEKNGMGVGLFYARHIVTHHKGKILINSTESKGTTVDILLPNARI